MRRKRGTRGQMRVIETLLASFIFFSALTFVNTFTATPSSPRYEASDLEKIGYNALHDLDDQGLLSRFVYDSSEWGELTLAISIFLSPDIYFNLTIYDARYAVINRDLPIRYGSQEVFAASDATASVSYILPGQGTEYDPRILLLELVRR